ncbi:peptide deformylase [Pontivivens ytuae]|uniref:Peptide deformylase n=1 Tax=Pontivivens ytuae TaxID=2789856 RepID=A0A7S9QEA9_9RHOB|nr:peptide deformylase [Pontivivens ytuae]QPH55868.1 peptide deformylase [Pontivivens ytuae]
MRTIVEVPDPILSRVAAPVVRFNPWLDALIADMARIRREMGGAGIAAPQVGESLRVFLLDARRADGTVAEHHAGIEPMVVVNPRITRTGDDIERGAEGCLSIPSTLLPEGRIEVMRPVSITWEGLSPGGEPIGGALSGFAARAFQHEMDHLDGILITDPARRLDP